MITRKLKIIFGLSIPLFIVHGIEEILTGFYNIDAWDQFLFTPFQALSMHGVMFVTFQMMFWLLLIISFLLILGEKWRLNVLAIAGLVYIIELHHLYKAVIIGGYYPGLYTALVFPIIVFFFWKEWFKIKKQTI